MERQKGGPKDRRTDGENLFYRILPAKARGPIKVALDATLWRFKITFATLFYNCERHFKFQILT